MIMEKGSGCGGRRAAAAVAVVAVAEDTRTEKDHFHL